MGLPLVTKEEYKAYANISSTNSDDAINSLIPKVSDLVKNVCRRTFVDYVNDPKVEYHEGGTSYLVLGEGPVIQISEVEVSTDFGSTYVTLTEFEDYALSKRDGNIVSVAKLFPYYINGYKVTYTAGYENVPEDLKVAVLDLITYYLKNDSAIHSNKAPGTNTVQIEYVVTTNLPAHIKRVLDLYAMNYN